ncbi:MAG: HAMP domain-containing histidine kinase [Clostridia bacterium]|nr:HAMP domain-containing histidine kinase [Clostridia bacterium]
MGVLVIALLILSVIILLISRRDKETFLITFLAVSLAEFWLTMLIYISKKGGFGTGLQALLFGTRQIRLYLQYLIFTLGQLGYILAVGRYLFPLFLMWLALYYSKRIPQRGKRWLYPLAAIIPGAALIIYYPRIFERTISLSTGMIQLLVRCTLGWIIAYLVIALALLILEVRETSMRFYRRQMIGRLMMIVSFVILYGLYCPQDPAQVYLFYRNEYMGAQQGLWYLNPALNQRTYILVFVLVIVCTGVGVYHMFRCAWESISEGQKENTIRRKFDAASKGASVFVHSVKNQLLANRVLLKRMDAELLRKEPNLEAVREHSQQLRKSNDFMIERMEELYRSIRTNSIVLVEENTDSVLDLAIERMKRKYPDAAITCDAPEHMTILCDKTHLAEALYNLLVNGWEAQSGMEQPEPLLLRVRRERLWTVISVTDHGKGLSREQRKHLYEPFWSSKNTNYNWGMGLYYVRQIVKSHLGLLRLEQAPGQGTSFIVQLPNFQRK